MPSPDLLAGAGAATFVESPSALRRRRVTVASTVLVGAFILHATLSAPRDSLRFGILGLLLALVWIVGAGVAGPLRAPHSDQRLGDRLETAGAAVLGLIAFVVFIGANVVARRITFLAHALDTLLPTMSTSASALVIAVVVANALGEEYFFRGALHAAFADWHPAAASTVVYVAVIAVTLNPALIAAAVGMGAVLSIERLATGRILASAVTHVAWGLLMLLAFPR